MIAEINKHLERYSTDEVRIGTWTDGKSIYKRTFQLTGIVTGNNDISHNIPIDTFINGYGALHFNNGWQPIPRAFDDGTYFISLGNVREYMFRIKVGTNYGGYVKGHITLEYTKTTD